MDPETPPPGQLYLILGADTAPAALAAVLDKANVACVLIRAGASDAAAEPLIALAQKRGVAVLLEDQAARAGELGCDGVHLNDPKTYKAARQALGAEASIGVACGNSRHAAMVAAEAGADYVAFGGLEPGQAPDRDLIAWWQTLMTVPCVALGARDAREAEALREAGADFVALGNWIWADPQGPAGAIGAAATALSDGQSRRSD